MKTRLQLTAVALVAFLLGELTVQPLGVPMPLAAAGPMLTRILGLEVVEGRQVINPRPLIKLVQRGSVALAGLTTNTATITSVDTANSILTFSGWRNNYTAYHAYNTAMRLAFTNATTITATRPADAFGETTSTILFQVAEFYPGSIKSIQRGTVQITSTNNSNTATITSVDTAKSLIYWLGVDGIGNDAADLTMCGIELTNATTVTAVRTTGGNSGNCLVGYQVVEYYF